MKFADMPVGERNRWLAWANSHDWGAKPAHWNDAGNLVAYGVEIDRAGNASEVRGEFDNPADLKAWAGY